VAGEASVGLEHHGVGGAERRRSRIEYIDRRRNIVLVRHRDRQTGDAEDAHRREGVDCGTRRHLERRIDPVEPAVEERGVVDHRAEAVAHR